MALIIVESPTKARTFNRILAITGQKDKYFVFATMGHFRDLPHDRMAINFKDSFKPEFEIMANKIKIVSQLKKLATENNEIILATDLDREGESIAYHAAYVLGYINENWPAIEMGKVNLKRIVFHEITPSALKEALEKPQLLRLDLVKAQLARRILDRVVGYELSPLLWKKMNKNWLSAGRVQTVALRLIVEREKEIKNFKVEEYYQIYTNFKGQSSNVNSDIKIENQNNFTSNVHENLIRAKLMSKDDVLYEEKAKLNLFAGEYTYTKTSIDEAKANIIENDLKTDSFHITDIKETIQTKYPPPPFTTSLLQQEAFHKFGFSSKMTMKIAQNLYEQGLITYHRTDSFNLSTQFVFGAQKYIKDTYGLEYALEKPRGYKTKSKLAQEAHEAIRPTQFSDKPEKAKKTKKMSSSSFSQYHERLYKLIFDRAIATQMKEAQVKAVTLSILSDKNYFLQAEKYQVIFDGFLKVLNPEYVKSNTSVINISKDQAINLMTIDSEKLLTKAPYRYNEATLIKILEERGIGRPSTYAPIISLLQDKNYIEKDFRYFKPTNLGEAISNYLSVSFPQIFDLEFTALMEDKLDKVATNEQDFIQLLKDFNTPFYQELENKKLDTSTITVEEEVDENCPKCGAKMLVKVSRFGKFLACSKYPQCKTTKSIIKPVGNVKCPECGGSIIVRFSKNKKRFYGCSNYPKCKYMAWVLASIK